MTVFFPDVASYQDGLIIQPGTVAVVAKATEGTDYVDACYAGFKTQALARGALFSGYHFLHQGNAAAQAGHAFAVVGPDVPLMLDVEPRPDIGSVPTVVDALAFLIRYRQLSGRDWGTYFPRWYWQRVGGDLGSLGNALIASDYSATSYSDTDLAWQPYGGATPAVLQYTDQQPYGGRRIDFNAFRGSVAELAALIQGEPAVSTAFPQPDVTAMAAAAGVNLTGKFATGQEVTGDACAFYADVRAEICIQLIQNLTKLLGPAAPAPVVDVDALAAALAPKLTAGATADELAHAVVMHLGADLAAG